MPLTSPTITTTDKGTTTISGGTVSGGSATRDTTTTCDPISGKGCDATQQVTQTATTQLTTPTASQILATPKAVTTATSPVTAPVPTLVTPIIYGGGGGGGGSSVAKQIADAKTVTDMVEPKIFGIPQKYFLIGVAVVIGYLFMSGKIKL